MVYECPHFIQICILKNIYIFEAFVVSEISSLAFKDRSQSDQTETVQRLMYVLPGLYHSWSPERESC